MLNSFRRYVTHDHLKPAWGRGSQGDAPMPIGSLRCRVGSCERKRLWCRLAFAVHKPRTHVKGVDKSGFHHSGFVLATHQDESFLRYAFKCPRVLHCEPSTTCNRLNGGFADGFSRRLIGRKPELLGAGPFARQAFEKLRWFHEALLCQQRRQVKSNRGAQKAIAVVGFSFGLCLRGGFRTLDLLIQTRLSKA